jgi:hypothetical protein
MSELKKHGQLPKIIFLHTTAPENKKETVKRNEMDSPQHVQVRIRTYLQLSTKQRLNHIVFILVYPALCYV